MILPAQITDTLYIGVGTSTTTSFGPIYRGSSTSTYNYSRYSYLYLNSELTAIPNGATINSVAWYKTNSSQTTVSGSDFDIFMKNTNTPSLTSGTAWATVISGATLSYSDTDQTIPSTIGWIPFDLVNPFTYTGDGLQISTDWETSNTTGNPSNGSFTWRYSTASGLGIGGANVSAMTTLGNSGVVGNNARPHIRIVYTYTSNVAVDLEANALVSPVSSPINCYGSSEDVVLRIRNTGQNTVNFGSTNAIVSATFSGATSQSYSTVLNVGIINPGETMDVTVATGVDMPALGNYTLTASVQLAGDGSSSNNSTQTTYSNTATTASMPLPVVDFTGYTGGNLPTIHPGWNETEGVGTFTSISGLASWFRDDFANNTSHPNGDAVKFNIYLTGDHDWIVGPKFLVDTDALLTYDCALTSYNTTTANTIGADDSVFVMISADGGRTFDKVKTYSSATPISNTGQNDTVDLAAYVGQEVFVAFYVVEGNVSSADIDFFLDNIKIQAPAGIDVSITDFISPSLPVTGCLSGAEPFIVELTNTGLNTIDFSTNNALVYGNVRESSTQNYIALVNSGTLAPGQSQQVTITANADLSAGGFTRLISYVQLSADENPLNDTLEVSYTSQNAVALPLPIVDFTGYNGSNLSTIDSLWDEGIGIGTPTIGSSIWVTDSYANNTSHPNGTSAKINIYSVNRRAWLLGPTITPDSFTILLYDIAMTAYANTLDTMLGSDDSLIVMGSFDCGTSYVPLKTYVNGDIIDNEGQQDTVFLGAYAGSDVRIAFYGTEGSFNDLNDVDVFIDNIQFGELDARDLAPVSLVAPTITPGGCYDGAEDLTVRVKNSGAMELNFGSTNALVQVAITGPTNQSFVALLNSGTLVSGGTLDVPMTTVADFSTPGTYTVSVYTTLSGDENVNNDTLDFTIERVPPVMPPTSVVDFTLFSGVNLSTAYPGWSEGVGGSEPAGTTSDWFYDDYLNDLTHPNDRAARISIGGNSGRDWMVAPKILADSSTYLRFDVGLTFSSSTNPAVLDGDDAFMVMVSTDCGLTYSPLKVFDANQNPIGAGGQTELLLLNAYAGQEIIVAFFATEGTVSGTFKDLFLDNVVFGELESFDIRVVDVVEPMLLPENCYEMTGNITTQIQNLSVNPIDFNQQNILMYANVDDGSGTTSYFMPVTSGVLGVGEMMDVTITTTADFSDTVTYEITSYVFAAADVYSDNDTVRVSRTTTAPLSSPLPLLDFTGYFGSNLETTHPGWYEAEGVDMPLGTTSAWVSDNFANTTNNNGTSIRVYIAYTDNYDWIVGPKIRPTVDTRMYYDVALTSGFGTNAATLGTDDTVKVMVSVDCGLTYIPVKIYSNSSVISNTGQKDTVDLSPYAGQDIIVAFLASDGDVDNGGMDFFLDNINITELPETDVAVVDVAEPSDLFGGCYGLAENISAIVKNGGSESIDFGTNNLLVYADVLEAGTGGTQNFIGLVNTGVLNPGDTRLVSITNSANMSGLGDYDVTVYCVLAGDTIQGNDTLAVSRTTRESGSMPFPILDFTTYTGANLSTIYPGWEEARGVGVPSIFASSWSASSFGGNAAHPNGSSLRINLYTLGKADWVISPAFLALPDAYMTYDYALTRYATSNPDSLGSDDVVQVLVSTDCGGTFVPVRTYDSNSMILPTGQQDTIDLSPYAFQEVMVAFYATEGTVDDPNDTDFYIDNINITRQVQHDVSPTEVLAGEVGQYCAGDSVPVSVVVCNLGSETQTSFPVIVNVNSGQTLLVNNWSGTLESGECDTALVGYIDASMGGLFEFLAVTGLASDQNLDNDNVNDSQSFFASSSGTPVGIDGIGCDTNIVTLEALIGAGEQAFWYLDSIGGSPLGTGALFETPALTQTTDFYLTTGGSALYSVGMPDTSIGASGIFTAFSEGLVFDVHQPCRLDSVTVYPTSSGLVVVNLLAADNSVIETTSFVYGGATGDTTLYLGFDLPVGTGLSLTMDGSTVGGFIRNTTGATYPYSIPDILDITQARNNLATYYYFFYDWKVLVTGCESERVPVKAIIGRDVFEPNNSLVQAADLPIIGTNRNAYLCDIADADWYSFEVDASSPHVRISLSGHTDNIDVGLYDAGQGLIASSQNLGLDDEIIVYNQAAAGTYYLYVYGGGDYEASEGYNLLVQSRNVAFDPSGPKVVVVTSVEEEFEGESWVRLYPNPSEGTFFVSLEGDHQDVASFVAYDMVGRVIWEKSENVVMGENVWEFDMNGVSEGMYLIEVRIGDRKYVERLQVVR